MYKYTEMNIIIPIELQSIKIQPDALVKQS